MNEAGRSTDLNIFRAVASLCDLVKTRLSLVNIVHVLLTPDTWLAALGVTAAVMTFVVDRKAPGWWLAPCLAVVTAPYVLYTLVAIFWRPVPFFRMTDDQFRPEPGEYAVRGFGWFEHTWEARSLIGNRQVQMKKRVRFFWSKGKLSVGEEEMSLDIEVAGTLFALNFWGVVRKPIAISIRPDSLETGVASLIARRVPAFRVETDDFTATLAIAGRL